MSTVLVSALTYELGKQLGIERASRQFIAQCEHPNRNSLPVARMIARLRQLSEVIVYHGFSTSLPKARSRAAHEALSSAADFWLMCDDDVECDTDTLGRMFVIAGTAVPAAVVLPCVLRGTAADRSEVNVQLTKGSIPISIGGFAAQTIDRGGTGMMLLNRAALERVSDHYRSELAWRDDDGVSKIALFQPILSGGEWLGEDFSFCDRLLAAGVGLWAVLDGVSLHAGEGLRLASIR